MQDYYHIFNRGTDDSPLFRDNDDFERFLIILYIANNAGHFIIKDSRPQDIFAAGRIGALVDIACYCLLPNRYDLILRDHGQNGAQRFIHKVATAYCMYYNRKYKHRGTIFAGTYRLQPISDENRLYELIRRVHLYPFSIKEEDDSKNRLEENKKKIGKFEGGNTAERAIDIASRYEYSSMRDYLGEDRPQKAILKHIVQG
jgi:hypothetical protein